jgi:hypothetical protein
MSRISAIEILKTIIITQDAVQIVIFILGRGFGLVVGAAVWHAGDSDSILAMQGLYTFGCIPPAP